MSQIAYTSIMEMATTTPQTKILIGRKRKYKRAARMART